MNKLPRLAVCNHRTGHLFYEFANDGPITCNSRPGILLQRIQSPPQSIG